MQQRERDAFLLLLHVYTLSGGDTQLELWGEQAARQLAFEDPDALALIRHLEIGGYLNCLHGHRFSITRKGIDYIEHVAGQRKSVRLDESSDPHAGS